MLFSNYTQTNFLKIIIKTTIFDTMDELYWKHLLVKCIEVHWHGCFPLFVVKFDRSKIKFGNPVVFGLTCSNIWFQVMPCASPSVTIEQLRVTLEPGNTVIGLVCSHTDERQEDFISQFLSVTVEASVE